MLDPEKDNVNCVAAYISAWLPGDPYSEEVLEVSRQKAQRLLELIDNDRQKSIEIAATLLFGIRDKP
jgi:hypothetical protein